MKDNNTIEKKKIIIKNKQENIKKKKSHANFKYSNYDICVYYKLPS